MATSPAADIPTDGTTNEHLASLLFDTDKEVVLKRDILAPDLRAAATAQ